ncbi:MAG TPA: penicillin-binding protein activator [Casimicrobiaceae bacterium]|nr:penicillin-binding protein activator [Casimicrobiaceae bacterium]
MPALYRSPSNPRSFARRRAIAFAAAVGLSALSAAQTPAASDETPAPAEGRSETGAAIALVLPLGSGTFGRAADAVRAGFLAAAAAANVKPMVVGHGDDDVLAAFNAAKEGGARVIVGPLVRDDLKKVAASGLELPPTVALNQLDDAAQLPANVYTLTLTLDSDARQLAHRAREAGATTVAVIASDSPLQQRFAQAFNAEWILTGGDAPIMFRFDRSPEVLRALRSDLIKAHADAALLAIDGADVALARSYVKSIPTYTSNQVNENLSREARYDLDDVLFVDIPWLVDPSGAAYAGLKRPDYPSVTLDRLYALGIDAFRVAQAFVDGAPERLDFDGATGRLSLDSSRQIVREGRLMVFRSGEVVSAETR